MDLFQALPDGPAYGDDKRTFVVAQLLSIDGTAQRATVSINGGVGVPLPYIFAASAYSGFTTVLVALDPLNSGSGQWVLGPVGTQVTPPAPPPPNTGGTKTVTTTIRPTTSGTYSEKWSRYYAWNVGRYGGSTTLYQSQAFGSQQLDGIALYGHQITALNATSISSITLHVPLETGSGTVTVQGDSRSSLSGKPTPSGTTASGSGTISLGSTLREALRTGSVNALVLTGSSYLAVSGTGSGMAMNVTYTRNT